MLRIRVATYNVRHEIEGGRDAWEPRRDDIAALVRSLSPDVLGVQEAIERQLDDLRERIPGYDWFGCGSNTGQNNPIGYRTDFERLDSRVSWLSETPETPESTGWDAVHPRALTEATIRPGGRGDSSALTVFNTHFDHGGERARRESARLIRRRVDALPADRPAVVVGDFNAREGSPVERILTDDGYDRVLRDAWTVSDSVSGPETTFTGFERPIPGRRLDRIFVTDGIDVRSARVRAERIDGTFPSDHLPVLAELLVPTGESGPESS